MKPRAWFFAAALVVGAVELVSACSEKVPLAARGGKCEYDEQCSEGLVCKCIKRRNPDDEGPDEIVAPGTCQSQDFNCKASDAGAGDTATPILDTGTVTDTGAAGDTGAATDSGAASTDANDGG